MNLARDDADAGDRLLDLGLSEELGGLRPPDLAARIAKATPERLAAAAASLDRASRPAPPRQIGPWLVGLAAALLLVCAGWALLAYTAPRPSDRTVRAQELIDEFHRAMPPSPALLRDPARRRVVAAAALPVLRRIRDGEGGFAVLPRGLREFEVYAVVLGDSQLTQDLERRAAAGDRASGAVLAIARAVVGEEAERRAALEELAGLLAQGSGLEAGFAQALVAADLTVAEAERLAGSFVDPALARGLVRSAAIAAQGLPHRVGQRVELFGRLADDSLFRSEHLRGRVVLVCFWASWCRPSCSALDAIRRLAARHAELAVVTVSCDHDPSALRAYLAEHDDAAWVQFFDRLRPGWHELARSYGVQLLPTMMLLDREGILRELPLLDELDAAIVRQLGR